MDKVSRCCQYSTLHQRSTTAKKGEDNCGDQQHQIRRMLRQLPRAQMLQWKFLNPAKLAWKSHYSPALLLRALQSFLPGWEYHTAVVPGRSGGCSWRSEGQPKHKRLGCTGQPSSSSRILRPTPHPYRKPHTCSVLLPDKHGLCRPSQKPR